MHGLILVPAPVWVQRQGFSQAPARQDIVISSHRLFAGVVAAALPDLGDALSRSLRREVMEGLLLGAFQCKVHHF